MSLPVIRGVMDRRILVNFRMDPDCLQRLLPQPLEPRLIRGVGIGGICLIRLKEIRPRFVPRQLGLRSENAAHRFAVQWGPPEQRHVGVYIPRRDTSSMVNALIGGRLFPGIHHYCHFHIRESDASLNIRLTGQAKEVILEVRARCTNVFPPTSIFKSLSEASRFFEDSSLGYSPARFPGTLDALELKTFSWAVSPLAVEYVSSSFFNDKNRFPEGSVIFDSALLMREIEHEWRTRESLSTPAFAT